MSLVSYQKQSNFLVSHWQIALPTSNLCLPCQFLSLPSRCYWGSISLSFFTGPTLLWFLPLNFITAGSNFLNLSFQTVDSHWLYDQSYEIWKQLLKKIVWKLEDKIGGLLQSHTQERGVGMENGDIEGFEKRLDGNCYHRTKWKALKVIFYLLRDWLQRWLKWPYWWLLILRH